MTVLVTSGGFQQKGSAVLKDTSGATFTLNFTLTLCGENFYETSVCTRVQPVEDEEEMAHMTLRQPWHISRARGMKLF